MKKDSFVTNNVAARSPRRLQKTISYGNVPCTKIKCACWMECALGVARESLAETSEISTENGEWQGMDRGEGLMVVRGSNKKDDYSMFRTTFLNQSPRLHLSLTHKLNVRP